MRGIMLSAACVCFALGAFTTFALARTFPYYHIHVNVPDPAGAANWFVRMGRR